jgi:5-methylcytosine-specific restriction endonuclease McrA
VSSQSRELDWDAIAAYYNAGYTVRECRQQFGFSNRAWTAAVARGDVQPRRDRSGRPRGETREKVRTLLEAGLSRAAIARELGISKPTVTHHAKALGLPSDSRCNRRYDWEEVQRYSDAGHSITACQVRFGFTRKTFMDAAKRGKIKTRPQAAPSTTYLISGQRQHRGTLKRALLRERLKENKCELCGIATWRDKPLALALHHINGDGHDNRLENLQLLCPNCHSQTENFAGRNVRRIADGNGASATPAS